MGMIKIPKESISHFFDNVREIFDTGNLAEGQWNEKVAQQVCDYTGAPYALATNSNGAGIFTLLKLLHRYRGKKRIFLQSNTMYGVRTISNSSGLAFCGYVDCSLEYLMPTFEQVVNFTRQIEKPNECVFLLTHIGGWVNPDIKKIAELCNQLGIALIEDCAHSLGSLLHGEHTGLFGDAGVYSLYATKSIPVGEGGVIVTRDSDLHEKAKKFVMYDRIEQNIDVGINLRMSEINALLTCSVLGNIDNIIENKYNIAGDYIEVCKEYGWDFIDPTDKGQRSNLYKFILISNDKDPVLTFSKIKNRTSPVYDYSLGADPAEIVRRHICLPVWYGLESDKVDAVVEELKTKSKLK